MLHVEEAMKTIFIKKRVAGSGVRLQTVLIYACIFYSDSLVPLDASKLATEDGVSSKDVCAS